MTTESTSKRGSTLRQVIEADKAGFLEHLDGIRQTYRAMDGRTQRETARNRGIAEGIEIAIRAVEAWQDAPGRTWLYGLTADEWFHLASEGADSEVAPCCDDIGELRDLLRELMTFQAWDERSFRRVIGDRIMTVVGAEIMAIGDPGDGGHDLAERTMYPLLNRVLDGIQAEQQAPGLQA
jgi:hypothetical protein